MNLKASLKRGPFDDHQADRLSEVLPKLNSNQIQWLNGYLTGIEAALQNRGISQSHIDAAGALVINKEPIWILFGTHTGNSESLANQTAKRLKELGREAKAVGMDAFKPNTLKKIKELLIIVSTDGEGDAPIQAEGFLEFLKGKRAPKLDHISYSVLALGDSSYAEFCKTGKDFDAALKAKGATAFSERVDCDVDYQENYEKWLTEVIKEVGTQQEEANHQESLQAAGTSVEAASIYSQKNPFYATVLEKISLNGRGSEKETIHLELDLEGSNLTYEPGDALGIIGLNKPELVSRVLSQLNFSGEEEVDTANGKKNLKTALREDYELTILTVLSLKKFVELTSSEKIKKILEDKDALAEYLHGRDVLDLLQEESYSFTPQEFISILRKNMPRMYSIASSQEEVDEEVHILVSSVRYEAHGRQKEGVCSTFLADQIEKDDQVKVFIDPNTRFKLPQDTSKPVIMVGPGTGIAPFRSFIQHRDAQEASGKSWLFFGDRNFHTDFLYQSEWLQYLDEGVLTRLDVAFSRDQKEKVYVQHKMLEHGKELYNWLTEGAHFYVCGDKDYMAKDVDSALLEIVKSHGNLQEEEASEYIKELRLSGRYQVDVY